MTKVTFMIFILMKISENVENGTKKRFWSDFDANTYLQNVL